MLTLAIISTVLLVLGYIGGYIRHENTAEAPADYIGGHLGLIVRLGTITSTIWLLYVY